jgi:DNA-binding transcriptional LysR family regulator
MTISSLPFDWNRARAFLATAEQGTLSAAARSLGLTQPTLGRQVSGLEEELGVVLFERIGKSLKLTASGVELLEHFKSMGSAADRISLTASGQSQSIKGQVCITASDAMAAYWLPSVLKRLRRSAPQIQIEIVASNELRDLRRREADIAIRHVRPDQPDLIAKLVSEGDAHLYASREYLAEIGNPTTIEDLRDATLIAFDTPERMVEQLQAFSIDLKAENCRLVTDSGVAGWEMAQRGLGICPMMDYIARDFPDMERVLPSLPKIPVPIWLATHRELHTSRRIRLVFDFLADAFKADKNRT